MLYIYIYYIYTRTHTLYHAQPLPRFTDPENSIYLRNG